MDKIKEIKEALEKATPGPWKWIDPGGLERKKLVGEWEIMNFGIGGVYDQVAGSEPDEDDAHLIANAPEWLAYLIGEVERSQVDKSKMHGFFMQKMWKILCAEVGNEKADEILEKFIEEGGMDYDLSRSSP